jgi:hypothetical protein
LLTLLVVAVSVAGGLLFLCTAAKFPMVIALITGGLFAISVLASWVRYGRRIISLAGLGYAVLYALWKIPLYARFLVARQLDWVRSKRDGDL